jgi:hypothetical protein
MAFGKFSKGVGGGVTYDSVKQNKSHTTMTGKSFPKGPVGAGPSKSEWVSTSATADKPIFMSGKKT